MATKYKVLAPYVTLKVRDHSGGTVLSGFYAGALLEAGTDAGQVDEDSMQHHLDSGLVVEEGDKVAESFAVPAGTPLPGQPPNVEVTERSTTAQPVPPLSEEQLELADGGRSRSRRGGQRSDKSDSKASDEAKG